MINIELSGFNEDDVVSVGAKDIYVNAGIHEGGTIAIATKNKFESHCRDLQQGIDCRLLRTTGGGWRKGKLRLQVSATIEFIPNEPDIEPPPGALVKG